MADMEYKNGALCLDKLDIGVQYEHIKDQEGRSEITTDSEGKIISYRDSAGVKHELVGINTKEVISNSGNIDVLNTKEINFVGVNPTKATSVYLEKPKFAEFYFYGNLPTDESSERIPTTLDFIYKVNGQALLSAKCTLAIQGHGSKSYPKKGYTFEPINVDGDAIDIKWGDMISVDSYHLKAYYSDRTHSRGVGGAKVWRKMVEQLPYPYNKVNNKTLNIERGQKIDAYCIADAKYSEDGFPCAFYLNDEFHGLYTMKLKKNRKNYGMEKSNKSEIFLDCLGFDDAPGHSAKLDDPFDAGAWDLKNPKLKNYEEGGPITDATVLANIERLFNFTNNITTMYAQHEDYIVLPHWLAWFIHCELIGDVDKNGNNLELATWDATHWSILPYDMDLTVGCYGGGHIYTEYSGYVLTPTFYQNFRNCYEQEIKELYTKLRKNGCIEINNLYKTYLGQIEAIPRFIYEMDVKRWPNGIWEDNEWPVLEQIYSYLESRIEYLDNVWLIND